MMPARTTRQPGGNGGAMSPLRLRPQPMPESVRDGAGFTVLLVDDEPAIRTLAGGVLRNKGYKVLEAGDGVAALELADRHDGAIHLLLTDWCMPRLDGGGLIRGLSAKRPGTAVLVMSSSVDAEPPPGTTILRKPFIMRDLLRKVQDAIDIAQACAITPSAGAGRTVELHTPPRHLASSASRGLKETRSLGRSIVVKMPTKTLPGVVRQGA